MTASTVASMWLGGAFDSGAPDTWCGLVFAGCEDLFEVCFGEADFSADSGVGHKAGGYLFAEPRF
jgi:hypothetical protein